ncbi:MAG: GH92 family glycosyl hydrolase [Odoribacteraceae bacterium]|nr:GH92 family glycosyl hydrolase [Odoribacteraceae bacterium]
MMKHTILLMSLLLLGASSAMAQKSRQEARQPSPAELVNPLMGTDSKGELSNGNTYPAIALPWGMNFWMPQTGRMGDGWAYTYDADKIRGFKQTHQPSPWINDYGQFALMPVVGMKIDQQSRASWFSHKTEVAHPYYYKVYLADHDVVAELAPTERCAYFRFTMPRTDSAIIVIDAFDRGSRVTLEQGGRRVTGYTTRNSGGVPANFKNYFVIEFDRAPAFQSVWENGQRRPGNDLSANHAGAIVGFRTSAGEVIHARVASSFISLEQAERNLQQEVGARSFDQITSQARARWDDVLGRVEVAGPERSRATFYSCLYRAVLFPRTFHEQDADGNPVHYSPYNGEVLPGYLFTDTGFWDTFRCLFPLLNLVYPSMNAQMQAGLLNTYKESGFLPEWASPGHRGCMIGNNSASVVTDAIIKGVTDPAIANDLYQAMLKGANNVHPRVSSTGRAGFAEYNRLGYVPYDIGINESAARTLEYAYDDWCISRAGRQLGRPAEEIALYEGRGQNYRNVFDLETRLMRGRNRDGSSQSPFNPFKWGDAFTEGNSWHYTWSVFHDPRGLAGLMGGRERFTAMLDSVFRLPPVFDASYYGGVIHEIREMQIMNMGNYAHGNQPIQHMIYLYNYSGAPWKAQFWAREAMDKLYQPTPDGYCGDEDNGQTSAWYVFSAIGFYPVCPGSTQYVIGSPLFDAVTVHLENGKTIKITAEENTPDNRYIQSLRVNGKSYSKNYLEHFDLLKGADLRFRMGAQPATSRGVGEDDAPYSFTH